MTISKEDSRFTTEKKGQANNAIPKRLGYTDRNDQ